MQCMEVARSVVERIDRASATKAVDSGSITGRVKDYNNCFLITDFLLDVQQLKGTVRSLHRVW